eukprot:TRINITY_DN566_c1_g6_i1.p1 TRINITY_DN566_c1_g6~~TRINITY_DN566_c1_g6_i1.p1  ORF type:complete len:626 (-),score=92.89 TRINITY_DN566_c1_g6_i1:58-1860(-)
MQGVAVKKSPRRNPTLATSYKLGWMGDKAGGDLTQPTFHNNPQFQLFFKKPEHVMISLTQDRDDNNLFDIGFYLIKGDGSGYPMPFVTQSDVLAQSGLKRAKTVDMKVDLTSQQGHSYFVVIPCTSEAKQECKFSLSFSCPNPDGETKIDVIRQQWSQIVVNGQWDTDGGTHNSPTFFDNPQYTLSLPNSDTKIHIRVDKHNVSKGDDLVGFYLIKENELSSFMYKPNSRIGFTNSTYAQKVLQGKAGEKYFLVPSLLNGEVGSSYTITLLSDRSVNLCPTEVRISADSIKSEEKRLVSAEPTPDLVEVPPPPGVFSRTAKSKLNTTTVKGEWSIAKKSAGGCINHHTWRTNPQYFLFASKPATAIIWIVQSPEDNKRQFDIGFYVLCREESEDIRKRKITLTSSEIVGKGIFQKSKEVAIKLDLEAGKSYVIIPCTYLPQQETTFVLNIATEFSQDWNLEVCIDPWSFVSVPGEWRGITAGGCPEDPTFSKNPQYQVKVLKPCELRIVLTQPSRPQLNIIGFYVIKTVLGSIVSFEENEIAAVGEFVDLEEVSAGFSVPEMGMYTIIPCTLNPGDEGSFELTVYANLPSCDIFIRLQPL